MAKKTVKPAETVAPVTDILAAPVANPNHIIISDTENPNAHWYVVHTYAGQEGRTSATLAQKVEAQDMGNLIKEILIPTQEKIKIAKGKKSTIKEKIFPGYILVRMEVNDDTWLAVRTTAGVTGFVGTGDRPTRLPDSEVAAIKKFVAQEAPKYQAAFTVGEAVKIVEGPFADMLGSVSEIDEGKGKVRVLVSIFGRETPVELDFLQVAKI